MAKIELARVDFRLIHGQIITRWRKVININKIIVIDDILAADEFMTKVYASAAPADITVKVYTEEKALRLWGKNQFGTGAVMILFKDIATCSRMIKEGLPLSEVQLGGVPHTEEKKLIMKAVSLNNGEMNLIKDLYEDYEVNFTIQVVPENAKMEYAEIVKIFNK